MSDEEFDRLREDIMDLYLAGEITGDEMGEQMRALSRRMKAEAA